MSVAWQQSTHGVQRRKEQINQVTARAFVVSIVLATLLMGGYLALGAANVRLSNEVWSLHNAMAQIQRDNSRLETEIARLSSIPVLQVRSVALGFAPAESIDYLRLGTP
ncbi:MAG: hypothetical protein MUF84_17925 [Anaerolineae bacterium]|jgi:cell division protein FtsB|nr:hypothetical protein [Anaerolineae bacterium]